MTVKCALSSNCDPNNRWNPKCDTNWHLTIRKKTQKIYCHRFGQSTELIFTVHGIFYDEQRAVDSQLLVSF